MALRLVALGLAAGRTAAAQVVLVPSTVSPAAWERFALQVVNQADTPVVAVRLEIPGAVQVLGVAAPPGWAAAFSPPTEDRAGAIEWAGGRLLKGALHEFAFLGRVAGDARPGAELVFPVVVTRENGARTEWGWGKAGRPPVVTIVGTAAVSAGAAFALAGAAAGVAALALALALGRRRSGS